MEIEGIEPIELSTQFKLKDKILKIFENRKMGFSC